MKIGNIFIQGGSPCHAIIAVDMAKISKNEIVFMLVQEIHILKNFHNTKNSPWYNNQKFKNS